MAEGVGDATPTMSATAKVERAMRISILLLPGDAGRVVEQMLTPASLTIITGSLLLWAGSHAFGIGEFVDVILLCAGVFTLGLSVFREPRRFWRLPRRLPARDLTLI